MAAVPESINFRSVLTAKVAAFGDTLSIVHGDRTCSYNELISLIQKSKSEYQVAGITNGSVVGLLADYSIEGIAAFLALLELAAIVAPISAHSENERIERISDCFAEYLVKPGKSIEKITPNKPTSRAHALLSKVRALNAAGLILFSSGSTGKPKVMLHNLDTYVAAFADKKKVDARMLTFLLFDHVGGINTLLTALSSGMTMVLTDSRDADVVARTIAETKVTILPTSPTFLNLLLMSDAHRNHDLSSLKSISYGTEPMPDTLLERLKIAFPNTKFVQMFGTSETGIAKTSNRAGDSAVLKFDPSTEFKIIDGELLLKSSTQVLGYLNIESEAFTEDGWYHTGDLVELSDDGYLKVIGRLKEMINVGGRKVLPEQVEDVISKMPEIADCLVFGEKNAITGESVAVEIVLKDKSGDPMSTKRLVRDFCKGKLEPYKIPSKVQIVDKVGYGDRFKKIRVRP